MIKKLGLNVRVLPHGQDPNDHECKHSHNVHQEREPNPQTPPPSNEALPAMPTDAEQPSFAPLHFTISILPDVSGAIGVSEMIEQVEESVVAGEIGQRFPTEGTEESLGKEESDNHMVDGLYNFAKLPGDFEHMVELPGSSVTTMVRISSLFNMKIR